MSENNYGHPGSEGWIAIVFITNSVLIGNARIMTSTPGSP